MDVSADVGQRVRGFYEQWSFPGYDKFETPGDLIEKARRGRYAQLLDDQIPSRVNILDVGCGTGQQAVFLSMANRRVVGIDFSFSSLKKGAEFKRRYQLGNVHFVQMDLFALGLLENCFDYVFCNGVLHHTSDAYGGFRSLCRTVKRNGYLIVGLYNKYGRLLVSLRKMLFKMTCDRFTWLDYQMRKENLAPDKKRIWFMDQYHNPHDSFFSVRQVLQWFSRNQIEFINALPSIRLDNQSDEGLFEKRAPGNAIEHILRQFSWILTTGREGGFFLMIGRKL